VPGCMAKLAHDFEEVGTHLAREHTDLGMKKYYDEYFVKLNVCTNDIFLYLTQYDNYNLLLLSEDKARGQQPFL
jgi:hypothetical protein